MQPQRIHYFQHVPFEGLGCIETWAFEKGHTLTATRFYTTDSLPDLKTIDWLVVMGGPMSVNDENEYPWLRNEKIFIKQAISAGKTVIGICLGAQLIANVLGADVYKNAYKEIGWFNVTRTPQAAPLLDALEPSFPVFHWHGDTFDLPDGALHLLQSEACMNQAFLYGQHVLGLQFHLEVTTENLRAMLRHGHQELVPSKYVQTEEEIVARESKIDANHKRLYSIFNKLSQPA